MQHESLAEHGGLAGIGDLKECWNLLSHGARINLRMTASEADAAETFIAVAAGDLTKGNIAKWFEAHSKVKRSRR